MTPKAVRALCEGGFEGIYGYTPQQVGDMTLDMISMLLANKKYLRSRPGKRRTAKMSITEAMSLKQSGGYVMGRDEFGNPIKGRIQGKSFASQLMEQEQAKLEAENRKKESRRRRRRKGKLSSEEERRLAREGR